MRSTITALIWQSWRLSRRWYLWVLPVAFALDILIMRQAGELAARSAAAFARTNGTSIVVPATEFAVLLAPSAMMMNFMLAMFATLLAVSLGSKAGFPLAFEFRLPVKTPLLVGVPMLTLAALCASLYVLPMLAVRLVYEVPVPLLPASALIAMLVVILLACGWSTVSSTARTFALLVGIVVAAQVFALLDPINMTGGGIVPGRASVFNRDVIALSGGEYAALAIFGAVLYALSAASIRKQRSGEAPALQLPRVAAAQPRKPAVSLTAILLRVSDRLAPACPTRSPWRAELWLEMRRQVLPILLLSVLVAAAVPLLYLTGRTPGENAGSADYLFPAVVFFGGIGIAIFNRRKESAGYMSAFEGTRGMSTLALASIQILSVAGSSLCGLLLVVTSLHFCAQFVDAHGDLALRIVAALSAAETQSLSYLAAAGVAQLGNYLASVMLLACMHTWSVVWGRWVPYGAGIVTIYGAAQVIRVQSGNATFDDIKQHLWGFAISVFVIAVLAIARTLYTKVLSLRAGAVAFVLWVGFVACRLYVAAQQGSSFRELAPEMQAFQGALLVAPLLLFVLLLWSYDRLRHR